MLTMGSHEPSNVVFVCVCVLYVCVCVGLTHAEDEEDSTSVYKLPHTKFQSSENGKPERSHTHPSHSGQSVFKFEDPSNDLRYLGTYFCGSHR